METSVQTISVFSCHPDETLFACVLIVFGIIIYTNSISFVSGVLNSER